MERVSIAIANWNKRDILRQCLASLRKQTFPDFAAYVVDNGSRDGSVEMVREEFPEVHLIEFPENKGFSVAKNAVFNRTDSEFVVSLDNDTELHPDWLKELVDILDARPEFGFATSMVLGFDDRSLIDGVGDGYGLLGKSFKIGENMVDRGQFSKPFEVFAATGCSVIYRRGLLDEIGAYDEDFFAYMEDVDLSIRARMAGHRCLAIPASRVYHMGHASTGGTTSEMSLMLTTKNIYNILAKDIPFTLLLVMLPLTIAAQVYLVGLTMLTGRPKGMRKSIKGYFRGLRALPREIPLMWRKRASVRRLKRIGTRDLFSQMRAAQAQRRAAIEGGEVADRQWPPAGGATGSAVSEMATENIESTS